ncbi:MAG: Plug domain-containing protein [Saprospiraceae bacterium]|nr:Plug domain-containing protein [Saprospiraceae bacterium]
MGETDVLKALQLLPGVQSGGEGQAGLYVRGGSPDQNLILLDGVPVYNANHLFDFFSL